MSLTERQILSLKATGKQHKHFDSGGLYVCVPNWCEAMATCLPLQRKGKDA